MDGLRRVLREWWDDPQSRLVLIGVLACAVLVNWPLADGLLADRRIARDGELLRAPVSETRNDGTDDDPDFRIAYTLPDGIDDRRWEARLDEVSWNRARLSSSVRVRVLREEPELHHVEGAIVGHPWRWFGALLNVSILTSAAYLLLVWIPRRRTMASAPSADPEEQT